MEIEAEQLISSRRNKLVHRLKALSSKKGREKYSSLLLEGTHLLEEILKGSLAPLEVIATKSWLRDHQQIAKKIPLDVPLIKVTEFVLQGALSTKTPDGVACILAIDDLPKLKTKPKFILALDRLQDPGNMGTIFRTALAGDVEIIWLALGADPLGQKVLRSSAGAVLKMPFERFSLAQEKALNVLLEKLKGASADGYQIIGTALPEAINSLNVLPYWKINWDKPTVLVLGNEGSGIDPLIKSICNYFVTVPHNSIVESLNVASVAVPLLLERRRAKMNSNMSINCE